MGNIVLDFDGVIIDSFQELLKIFQDFDGSVTKADILDCFDSSIDTQDKRPWQQIETASPNWIANSWEEIEGIIESYFK